VKRTQWRPWLPVVTSGESMISTAGAVLLAQTARISGLERHLSTSMQPWTGPRATHDPAKILLDLAITVALGGDCAADIAVLRAQPEAFGPVASDPTVSRAIDTLAQTGTDVLTTIRAARASARAWVWQRAGAPTQSGWIVLDPDATVLISHSEKEDATKTWKKTFGFHPLLVFCDHGEHGTGEPVAGLLRRGNAGSNTAADHLTVLDDALAQIPPHLREPDEQGKVKVLVRTDAAGATHARSPPGSPDWAWSSPSARICITSIFTPC
jgi:Transposase DDE domain group 1